MTSLESIFAPSRARITRKTVADVPNGAIVRYQGEWGVIFKRVWLDRWIGGPIRLHPADVVEVLEEHDRSGP